MILKNDSEELWHVKGELVNIATAMGLHRDPGKEMPCEVAERRRWAWWNVIIIERYVHGGIYRVVLGPNHLGLLQLASIFDWTPSRNRVTPF
jgi:hypothetical protein